MEELIYEDDEKRIWRSEGGTPGEPGHWTSERIEWKIERPLTSEEQLHVDVDTLKASLGEQAQPWFAGEAVEVGDRRAYNGYVYACIQAHTTQSDWTPDIVPALWGKQGPAAANVTDWIEKLTDLRDSITDAQLRQVVDILIGRE